MRLGLSKIVQNERAGLQAVRAAMAARFPLISIMIVIAPSGAMTATT